MMIFKNNSKEYEHQTGYVVQLVAQAIGEGELTKEMTDKAVCWLKDKLKQPTKICRTCHAEKPLENYWKGKTECKKCYNKYRRERAREKYNNDEIYNAKERYRKMFRSALNSKDYTKSPSYELFKKICGCDVETYQNYMKMTYRRRYNEEYDESRKDIQIGHKVAISKATTIEEVEKLWNLENLMLIRKDDNLEMGTKNEDFLTGEYF